MAKPVKHSRCRRCGDSISWGSPKPCLGKGIDATLCANCNAVDAIKERLSQNGTMGTDELRELPRLIRFEDGDEAVAGRFALCVKRSEEEGRL